MRGIQLMTFSYNFPYDFQSKLVRLMNKNFDSKIVSAIQNCNYTYQDIGFAYNVGVTGNTWDKHN